GEGVLNVTAGGSGAVVNNSGTSAVTITGTAAQINALLNTDGTSTVGYIDNTDTPAANTTLTLLIHDNGNTGTGGDHSSSDTATINITAINDAPVFTNLGEGAHPNFIENGSSVVLDNNVTVSDPELNAAGNYGGATLTLARNGGANADDTFAGTGTLDLADSNGLGENVSLDGGATFIGTFSQPGDGTFSITFNAGATAANVASVMQQIVYANTSDNPEASIQIGWSFGDSNTGAQGSGGAGVATGSVTVDIAQVDDAPVLINVAPSAAYVPGTSGAVLSSTLGILDLDAVAPSPLLGLASATIKIDSGFFAGDELFVNLATSGGHFVTPDGDTTNISVQSNVLGALILSGNDTVAHYQSVLDAVSYHSTAADPGNGGANPTRNISWQVNDGALNSQTPNPDPNNLVSETVLHFDRAPQLDLDASGAGTGFTTTFTENGAPIAIVDTDLSIADSDDVNLDSATIVLTNAKPTDVLSIAGALPGGIDSSIDTSTPGRIAVHLSNSASLADYQTALGQIRFVNSSDTPDTTDRDITVSVANGADSNVAHATIHVIAVDDAPVAANASAGGSEDAPIPGIVSATDVDNTASQLSYSLVGANGGAAHGAVVFHADGSYIYNPVHDFNGSDSFSFKANDGQLDSNVATVSLAVSAVNDAPVAAQGSASGNEDTPISGAVSASDVDNTPGQLSYALVGANGGAAHGTVAFNANGTFTYTPASNFNGSDSFSFKANDGALDSNVATESLTINAVNDAPVNTVAGPLNAQNGLDAAIIGLAVSDVDAVSLTTSLHVDHGTLAVAAVGGATVSGSGTGTVTLSGSVGQINAALGAQNNVVYQTAFDFAGTDHLTMTSNDGGGTGSGGPQTDTDGVDINAGHSMGAFLAFSILGSSDFHLH
ncbi:MAG TPA: Ig-like domain-containing protein, partial [Bradyrhizobium sp.]|nr:Ig-like domain-containing protein [Bradyrhizobium sp.]